MKIRRETSNSKFRQFLNGIHQDFHSAEFLYSDPIEFVHRYEDPWDQETVALLAAVLAYGKVAQIKKSVEDALRRMSRVSPSPRAFVENLSNPTFKRKALKAFDGFVHRFNSDSDLVVLLGLLNQSWKKYGSLGAHFVNHLSPQDAHIGKALKNLISDWRSWLMPEETAQSFHYLLTSPEEGSCCKRWCMFLRWMGRKDEIDPGLWMNDKDGGNSLSRLFPKGRSLNSNQLIMPLDTHTGRISQYLGLTSRKSLNWKAAVEITAALKSVDPTDPTRYDFALSRLGILDLCQRIYREEICKKCQLLPVCQFAQKKLSPFASQSMQHSA